MNETGLSANNEAHPGEMRPHISRVMSFQTTSALMMSAAIPGTRNSSGYDKVNVFDNQ
jgi:hypothetical protein